MTWVANKLRSIRTIHILKIFIISMFLHPIIHITVVWISLEWSPSHVFKLVNIYKVFLLNYNFIILDQWSKKEKALHFPLGTYVLSNLVSGKISLTSLLEGLYLLLPFLLSCLSFSSLVLKTVTDTLNLFLTFIKFMWLWWIFNLDTVDYIKELLEF